MIPKVLAENVQEPVAPAVPQSLDEMKSIEQKKKRKTLNWSASRRPFFFVGWSRSIQDQLHTQPEPADSQPPAAPAARRNSLPRPPDAFETYRREDVPVLPLAEHDRRVDLPLVRRECRCFFFRHDVSFWVVSAALAAQNFAAS
jgi:hypothetical protein